MAKPKKKEKQFTRRDFLKASGATLASVVFFNALGGCARTTTLTETVTSTATTSATITKTATSTAAATDITTLTPTPTTRVITDMAGRQVILPTAISRIATVGSVGVLNGFVFAMGQASKVVTGLPPNFDVPSWKYQYVVAPNIKDLPKVQAQGSALQIEELLKVNPDVVFTMDLTTVTTLENANLATVYLSWTQAEDVKQCMTLLGEIFGEEERAQAYIQYFDDSLNKTRAVTAAIPEAERVRVFYGTLSGLNNPHLISEWWIDAAGGLSVTRDIHTTESITVHSEDMVLWNPQVIFFSSAGELEAIETDARFAQLDAVKNKRCYLIPKGVHTWGNRNVEQPLTVLWAGSRMYPQAFESIDIYTEVKDFYGRFYNTAISDDQVDEILSGDIASF